MNNTASWRDYVQLTKPRIILSNLIAAFGGFWMASGWQINLLTLVLMLAGSSIVMASACVFNNYLDRDLDQKMARTQNRALPTGRIAPSHVLIYGAILGVVGTVLLALIHWLSAVLGLVGIFVYVIIYTLWLKRSSTWSTSVGGISGAMPPVIGYVSVSEQLDAGAWILFAILFLWQPPHFWALGIRRKEEYRAAGFPLLPVVKGVRRTKWQMLPYVALLIPTSILLYTFDYVGVIYLVVAVVLGAYWLWLCISGLWAKDDEAWSKRAFMFSLYYLTITFAVIIVDTVRV